ncbi:MAG: methyltransferase domain-containing protein [Roseinatronobacter sp.]
MRLRSPRIKRILKHADLTQKGIEVAPYYKPLVSKAKHDVLIIDVFETDELRRRAEADPLIEDTSRIEPVDLVGDASDIERLVTDAGHAGQIAYIVSSHNFEHLPNPIKFLRGCSAILKPGGVVSMAVPDGRACFDFYRMPTRLSDWLAAYHEDRRQPSAETLFDALSLQSMYLKRGKLRPACGIGRDSPRRFIANHKLAETYDLYKQVKADPGGYRDAHCSVFFPETVELMLRDLNFLGLLDLEIIEVSKSKGHEFIIHLRKPKTPSSEPEKAFYTRRDALMARITQNLGAAPYHWTRLLMRPDRLIRRLVSLMR